MGLIYDINENEIMSHIEDGTLNQWITTWRRCVFENTDKITLSPIKEDNTMTIIFAKHDGCDKEFIFEVPAGMYPKKNDVLWVDTACLNPYIFMSDKTKDAIFRIRLMDLKTLSK